MTYKPKGGNTYTKQGLNFKQMPRLKQQTKVDAQSLVYRVVEKQNTRSRKDVGSWREAIKQAENVERPRRIRLYDIYDDLVLDNHMASLMQTRKQRVLAMPFRIVNKTTREVDAEKTNLLERPWFYKFLELALEAQFWGFSLIEFQPLNDEGEFSDVKLVPRKHVLPETGMFLVEPTDDAGIAYRDSPLMSTLVEVGDYKDLGLLNKAAPQILFKKNAQSAWAEYCEVFGMPMRVGKTNTRNATDLDRMADSLKNMAQGAYAVMDLTEEISFVESTKGDAYNVYDKLITRANSEMSKLVLGQTMTTDVGENGSRAQAEVHEQQGDYIFAADMRKTKHLVNRDVFRVMVENGYPVDGFEFEWVETKVITEQEWNIDSGLLERFEIEEKYFIDKYGVPIIGVRKAAPAPTPEPPPEKPKPTKKPPQKKNLNLTGIIELLYGDMPTTLAKGDDIDLGYADWMGAIEGFLNDVQKGKIKPENLNEDLFWNTVTQLNKGAKKGDKKGFIDVDFTTPDYNYRNKVRQSLFAFAGAKTHQHLSEINALLLDDKGKTVPFSTFKKNVEEYRQKTMQINEKYNSTWLQAEYNTALNQAQANRRYQDILDNADIQPNVMYQTVGDSKVTEPCIHLNGVIQPIHSNWVKTYAPQNHWQCRCRLTGTTSPPTANPPTPTVPPGFSGNAFDLGYIITPQHPYFNMDKQTLDKVTNRTNDIVKERHVKNQEQAYDELDSEVYTKETFDKTSGGYHAAHVEAQALIPEEKVVVDYLVKKGHAVVRPPYSKEQYQKNFDATVDGAKVDFKSTTRTKKDRIEESITGAKGQANSVVLHFVKNINTNELARAIYNKMGKNAYINLLYIIYKNKSVVITKVDVANKTVEALLKTIAG